LFFQTYSTPGSSCKFHVGAIKDSFQPGRKERQGWKEEDRYSQDEMILFLSPGTGRHLRAVERYDKKNVRTFISPYPLGDQLLDPVVYAHHGLVRICKVGHDGVESIPIAVDVGHVARVVALEIKRDSGLSAGRWKLMRVDDHGGAKGMMLWG
jgi:hypothetical protein